MVGAATGMSAQFGESFLCRNGLPIRISYTGSMSDAQNNPEFEGYATFIGEYRNRDYRFVGCTFLPDRVSYSSRTEDGRQRMDASQPYLLLCFLRTMIIMILLIPYIVVLVQSSIPQLEIIVQWGIQQP